MRRPKRDHWASWKVLAQLSSDTFIDLQNQSGGIALEMDIVMNLAGEACMNLLLLRDWSLGRQSVDVLHQVSILSSIIYHGINVLPLIECLYSY